MKTVIANFLVFGMALATSVAQARGSDPELFELVEMLRQKAPNAGMAVGIVTSEGLQSFSAHGFEDHETKTPITADSLFMIGSTTKAFTSMAAAIKVDDGDLTWDQPVSSVISEFKLSDPELTDQVTLRDLLLHRTGLPRYDLYWLSLDLDMGDMFEFIPKMKFAAPFRKHWIYNNYMYAAAGIMAGRADNPNCTNCGSWENLVRTRILDRLRMDRTRFHVAEVESMNQVAQPHNPDGVGGFTKIPMREIGAHAPAGSIHSSVKDMSRWLMVLLNRGYIGRREQLVSLKNFDEVFKPQIHVGQVYRYEEASEVDYSLAWMQYEFHGAKVIEHGGGIDGYLTNVAFLPEHDFGVIVLTNGGSLAPASIMHSVVDHYVTKKGGDFFKKSERSVPEKQKYLKNGQRLAGKFHNSTWGEVTIAHVDTPEGAVLTVKLNNFPLFGSKIHRADDGKIILSDLPAPWKLYFIETESEGLEFYANFEPMLPEERFTRQPMTLMTETPLKNSFEFHEVANFTAVNPSSNN